MSSASAASSGARNRAVPPPRTYKTEHVSDPMRRRLIAARKALGISQAEMAAHLLTPLGTYEQWESGRHRTPGIAAISAEQMCELEGVVIMPDDEGTA